MTTAAEAVAAIRAEHPDLSLASIKILARWFHAGDQTRLCTSPPHAVLTTQYGGLGALFALETARLVEIDHGRERRDQGVYAYVGTPDSARLGGPLWRATMQHVLETSARSEPPCEPDYGVAE